MYTISNHFLTAEFSPIGAELIGLTEKETGISYLWNGDPKFWGRRAPLLFPIVGKLKNGSMMFQSKNYQIDQHGFIRDMAFTVLHHDESSISWECISNKETKTKFPFDWKVVCSFTLLDNVLQVSTTVTNTSSETMFFSIGYHPAFKVPIDPNLTMEDYSLVFDTDDKSEKWLIKDGLIDAQTEEGLTNGRIHIDKTTFLHDALVFKGLKSEKISIVSDKSLKALHFHCKNYPYLGIWSKPEAPFVCIEPWHGIADSVGHDGDFITKEGILSLQPSDTFTCGYDVEIF